MNTLDKLIHTTVNRMTDKQEQWQHLDSEWTSNLNILEKAQRRCQYHLISYNIDARILDTLLWLKRNQLSLLHTLATVLMVCFLCSAIITLAAIAYGSPIILAGFALMLLTGFPFSITEQHITNIENNR